MDKLEAIMSKQLKLQQRLGTNFSDMTPQDRADFMRNHRGYLADEVAEALYEMPFYKLWKDYDNMSSEGYEIAWQKVRMELIDSLHFFVNLLLCAGMTADEVYNMYMAKNKENHRRQDDGYTSDVSYRDQAVEDVYCAECAIDFDGVSESPDLPICRVENMPEQVGVASPEFIAILYNGNELQTFYNTSIIRLGEAVKVMSETFDNVLSGYSTEDQEQILSIISGGTDDE